MIAVTRTGALDEGDILRLLAVLAHDPAAGRALRVGHALEFDVGDDVVEAVVPVGLDLGRVVRLPAGGPDHGARRELDLALGHLEIDGVIFARVLGLLRVVGADDARVDHVLHRMRHHMRQVGALALGHAVVVLVVELGLDGLAAVAATGAVVVDITWRQFHRRGIRAGLALDVGHLGHRDDGQVRVHLGPALVDLQPAGGMTQLGEVLVQLAYAAAQIGALFNQHDLFPGLGGLERGSHATDAATDDENGLVGGYDFRHG